MWGGAGGKHSFLPLAEPCHWHILCDILVDVIKLGLLHEKVKVVHINLRNGLHVCVLVLSAAGHDEDGGKLCSQVGLCK